VLTRVCGGMLKICLINHTGRIMGRLFLFLILKQKNDYDAAEGAGAATGLAVETISSWLA
jgi:hypothetical protein